VVSGLLSPRRFCTSRWKLRSTRPSLARDKSARTGPSRCGFRWALVLLRGPLEADKHAPARLCFCNEDRHDEGAQVYNVSCLYSALQAGDMAGRNASARCVSSCQKVASNVSASPPDASLRPSRVATC
jgi:hypothetical protein